MASHPRLGARTRAGARVTRFRAVAYVLLLGECLVILIPTVYGRATPKLAGIPFFYWFQLLWIIVGMVVTGIAYLLFEAGEPATARGTPGAAGAPGTPGAAVDDREVGR